MDEVKELCIKQGYFPLECKLDVRLFWELVNDGRNPCIGCNAICHIENNEELFHLGNVSTEPCSGTTSLAIQRKRWLWR